MMSNRKYTLLCRYEVCIWALVWAHHTGSLEVDASHLHRVRWVMGHHLRIAQKTLGPGFRILAFAAQTAVSQKSN